MPSTKREKDRKENLEFVEGSAESKGSAGASGSALGIDQIDKIRPVLKELERILGSSAFTVVAWVAAVVSFIVNILAPHKLIYGIFALLVLLSAAIILVSLYELFLETKPEETRPKTESTGAQISSNSTWQIALSPRRIRALKRLGGFLGLFLVLSLVWQISLLSFRSAWRAAIVDIASINYSSELLSVAPEANCPAATEKNLEGFDAFVNKRQIQSLYTGSKAFVTERWLLMAVTNCDTLSIENDIDLLDDGFRHDIILAADKIYLSPGKHIYFGSRNLTIAARKFQFGEGAAIASFPEGGAKRGRYGEAGEPGGMLTIITLEEPPAAGKLRVDLRGTPGNEGERGPDWDPPKAPDLDQDTSQYRYKDRTDDIENNLGPVSGIEECEDSDKKPQGYKRPKNGSTPITPSVAYLAKFVACRNGSSSFDTRKQLEELDAKVKDGTLKTLCFSSVRRGKPGKSGDAGKTGESGGKGGNHGTFALVYTNATLGNLPKWVDLITTPTVGGIGGMPGRAQLGGAGEPSLDPPTGFEGCPPSGPGDYGQPGKPGSPGLPGAPGDAKAAIVVPIQSAPGMFSP